MKPIIKSLQFKIHLLAKIICQHLSFVLKKTLLGTIKIYQKTLSSVFGKSCRFYPSCSSYALESLQLHGVTIGLFLTLKRLCKCHPFHPGGVDLVPVKEGSDSHEESIK